MMVKTIARMTAPFLAHLLVLTLVAPSAQGQADERITLEQLGEVRQKTSALTDEERGLIERWVGAQLKNLVARLEEPSATAKDALNNMKKAIQVHDHIIKAHEGSEAYQQAYCQILTKAVSAEISPARSPVVAIFNAMLLAQVGDPQLLDAYRQLLGEKVPAMQYWALKGLITVRSKLSTAQLQQVVGDLDALLKTPPSEPLAELAFQFLNQPENTVCRSALISVLTARSEGYARRNFVSLRADRELIAAAEAAYASSDGPQQGAILLALGKMLAGAGDVATAANPTSKRRRALLQLVIYTLEGALDSLTAKNGGRPATEALGAGDQAKARAALISWVGDGQRAGLLNTAPYNLPPLLVEAPNVPTTKPAES